MSKAKIIKHGAICQSGMIRLTMPHTGGYTVRYVAPKAIAVIGEAGLALEKHGVKSCVRTFIGVTYDCQESAEDILAAMHELEASHAPTDNPT